MRLTSIAFFTTLIILIFRASLYGQVAVTPSGGNVRSQSGSFSYTVGQVFYNSVSSASSVISEGVQQPWEITVISGIPEAYGISLNVLAFPNPVVDYLTLKMDGYNPEGITYQLFDMSGKLLESKAVYGPETRISMASKHPATYILRVVDKHREIKAFRIVKF